MQIDVVLIDRKRPEHVMRGLGSTPEGPKLLPFDDLKEAGVRGC